MDARLTDHRPTDHPLQPHHISLLAILLLTFKDLHLKNFDPAFLLGLQRFLLDQVSEVTKPEFAWSLWEKLARLPRSTEENSLTVIQAFRAFKLETTDHLINFFTGIPVLYQEKDEPPEPIFGRRSIFGFFCRRCCVSFGKLSFSGVIQLHKDFQEWSLQDPLFHRPINLAAYRPSFKDELNNTDSQIFKTHGDRQNWARADTYKSWIQGRLIGDDTLAKESLRSFFEQRFHEGNDSGVRQLGLLNMVRYHYIHGEYFAGRKLLSEAISVSRTSGDKIALQQCISLLRRFPPVDDEHRPPLNEIQPNLNPLDILYDVRKLIDETNEQPISASFIKIAEAVGVFDYWCDTKLSTIRQSDQWAQYAVQANVWNAAGCEDLGDLATDIVVIFTSSDVEDNSRLTVLLNHAYRQARQGKYDSAVAMLLDERIWGRITLPDYKIWAQGVWQILALKFTRRSGPFISRVLASTATPGRTQSSTLCSYVWADISRKISESLAEVLRMRDHESSGTAIDHLLKSLWHSEFLFRMHHYRTAIVLLADAGLDLGLSKRSRKMIEDIMPQIITGNDIEQRAFAVFTLARCIIAESSSPSALQEAVWWLVIAEKDYLALQICRSAMDVQYLLATVYNTLGLEQERDAVAKRYEGTQKLLARCEMAVIDEEAGKILDMVAAIGAKELPLRY